MTDETPTIRYACATTPLGPMQIAATQKGLCQLAFGGSLAAFVTHLNTVFANAACIEDPGALAPFIAQINAWLHSQRQHFTLPLDLAHSVVATPFRQRVWHALQQIPYGETRSYAQLAQTLHAPRAARAVASACAANPVALVIPCHRVIQKNGALAGYRWGVQRKAALLRLEASACTAQAGSEAKC
jgi:AraC family transcriptional regulator of adaptative response/methylated-DNA-[protein]-cysteine methyltransferase